MRPPSKVAMKRKKPIPEFHSIEELARFWDTHDSTEYELEDVPDVGSAERIDRLIRVPDHRQVPVLARQQLEQPVLGVVGVLVLVDEHVAEGRAVAVAHLLEELEHVDRAHEQVVEVHRVHAVQLGLVELVDVDDRLLEVRAHHLPVGLRVAQLVLRV